MIEIKRSPGYEVQFRDQGDPFPTFTYSEAVHVAEAWSRAGVPSHEAVIVRDASNTRGESSVARYVDGVKVFPFPLPPLLLNEDYTYGCT